MSMSDKFNEWLSEYGRGRYKVTEYDLSAAWNKAIEVSEAKKQEEIEQASEETRQQCAQKCRLYAKHQDPMNYSEAAYDAIQITCDNLSDAIRNAGKQDRGEG